MEPVGLSWLVWTKKCQNSVRLILPDFFPHLPHIHARYQNEEVVLSIPEGKVLEGGIKSNKLKLVQAWTEIHKDELIADWELASKRQNVFPIEPLR